MSVLPSRWEWTTIGEVADVQLGRQRSPKNHYGAHMRPYLRAANVTWRGIDISDVKEMNFEPAEASVFELKPGDLLLNEASGSANEVGKPAIWRGEIEDCCFQNTLLRVQPRGVSTEYLYWYCRANALSGRFGEAGRGVNIRHLGKAGLASFPLALPPRDEQDRIVGAIEEHLSHLDAGREGVRRARLRLEHAYMALAESLVEGAGPLVPVGQFAESSPNAMAIGPFGSNLKVSDYQDDGVPLVFVRDIRRGQFGGEGTRFVSPEKAAELASHIVRHGDVLVTKMGDPPGDATVYSGPDAVITADCIKLSPAADVYASFVVAALGTKRARDEVLSITKGVAQKKVSLGRFRDSVFLPKPDFETQVEIADRLAVHSLGIQRLGEAITAAERRSSLLGRSVLAAAFSGQLVPQDPGDEPASVLLDRVKAVRAAGALARRSRKVTS